MINKYYIPIIFLLMMIIKNVVIVIDYLLYLPTSHKKYDILRRQLVESQWFVLHHILRYPSLYAPMTRMYIGKNSSGWTVWSDPAKFFVEIFATDYRALFEEKLQKITQIMNATKIKPIDVF